MTSSASISEVIIFDLLALAPPGPTADRFCEILGPIFSDPGSLRQLNVA